MTTIHACVLIARVYLVIDYSQKWVTTAVTSGCGNDVTEKRSPWARSPNFGYQYPLEGQRLIAFFEKLYVSRVGKYVIAMWKW